MCLSESCAFTINELSSIFILSSVHDVLANPERTKAPMNEEMEAW